MEKSLYLECSAGISGDMTVAALLDAGADKDVLLKVLDTIPVRGFTVAISKVKKAGIECTDFNVILNGQETHDHDMEYLFGHTHTAHGHSHSSESVSHEHGHHHAHRNVNDILNIIRLTDMTDGARALAQKILYIIAGAEAKAHGLAIEQVHFHEVGALDSIVDIISMAVCFDNLHIERVYVPYVNEGTGTIRCAHGILPVPVPAVLAIVSSYNVPLHILNESGEFVTPTGAAFVAAVRTDGVLPPVFSVERIGLGAGKRAYHTANILRAMILSSSQTSDEDTICKLETNIDDSTGEALGFVMEELFVAGAKDVHYIPCTMKKNRPGVILTVICSNADVSKLEDIIFAHTTSIGIRRTAMERTILPRKMISLETLYGTVHVKLVRIQGTERVYPEYEDVAALCRKHKKSFSEVYNEIKNMYNKQTCSETEGFERV